MVWTCLNPSPAEGSVRVCGDALDAGPYHLCLCLLLGIRASKWIWHENPGTIYHVHRHIVVSLGYFFRRVVRCCMSPFSCITSRQLNLQVIERIVLVRGLKNIKGLLSSKCLRSQSSRPSMPLYEKALGMKLSSNSPSSWCMRAFKRRWFSWHCDLSLTSVAWQK